MNTNQSNKRLLSAMIGTCVIKEKLKLENLYGYDLPQDVIAEHILNNIDCKIDFNDVFDELEKFTFCKDSSVVRIMAITIANIKPKLIWSKQ